MAATQAAPSSPPTGDLEGTHRRRSWQPLTLQAASLAPAATPEATALASRRQPGPQPTPPLWRLALSAETPLLSVARLALSAVAPLLSVAGRRKPDEKKGVPDPPHPGGTGGPSPLLHSGGFLGPLLGGSLGPLFVELPGPPVGGFLGPLVQWLLAPPVGGFPEPSARGFPALPIGGFLGSISVLRVRVLQLHLCKLKNLPLDAPAALQPLLEGSSIRIQNRPQTPAPTLQDHCTLHSLITMLSALLHRHQKAAIIVPTHSVIRDIRVKKMLLNTLTTFTRILFSFAEWICTMPRLPSSIHPRRPHEPHAQEAPQPSSSRLSLGR